MKFKLNNAIIAVLLGLGCILIITLIIVPSIRDILNLAQKIESQRVELESMYQRGRSLKKTHTDYESIKDKLPKIKNILLRPGEELGFITSLEELASQNNVEQKITIDTESLKKTGGYSTMVVHLDLLGKYKDILGYIIDLEKLDYYLNFKQINIANENARLFNTKPGLPENPVLSIQSQGGGSDNKIKVNIVALSYWRSGE